MQTRTVGAKASFKIELMLNILNEDVQDCDLEEMVGLAMPALLETPHQAEVAEPATPLNTETDIKDNLKTFTDSLHTKASMVTSWLNQLDPQSSEKCKEQLVRQVLSNSFGFGLFLDVFGSCKMNQTATCRFADRCQAILTQFESFLSLAECQHLLETGGKSQELLGTGVLSVQVQCQG